MAVAADHRDAFRTEAQDSPGCTHRNAPCVRPVSAPDAILTAVEKGDGARVGPRDRAHGDERQQQLKSDTAAMKNMELDMLPPDLAGQVKGLQNYDFESQAAREQFEQLMGQLREQLMQQQLDQISEGINDMSPEDMQQMMKMQQQMCAPPPRL